MYVHLMKTKEQLSFNGNYTKYTNKEWEISEGDAKLYYELVPPKSLRSKTRKHCSFRHLLLITNLKSKLHENLIFIKIGSLDILQFNWTFHHDCYTK